MACINLLLLQTFTFEIINVKNYHPNDHSKTLQILLSMSEATNVRFQVTHFEINLWILAILNLLFDDYSSPRIELYLECMFQQPLQNDIYWLEHTSVISWNKYHQDIWVCFFHLVQKITTLMHIPTIQQPHHLLTFLQF